ncbi:protein SIEVE ELEMENT OCCLUSION B-like [Euphorbia lathyris]|uniref:protein SIEVE ELEMENT OCCLUSION B-like n=1 Tax=Euphorbia lathyris TaxID=212925 RepID=UPI0033138EF7
MKQEDILNALREINKKSNQQNSSTNLDEGWFLKEFGEDPKSSEKKVDVKPLFHLVEDILNRAIQNVNRSVMDTRAYMEDESHKEEVILLREKLSHIMDRIAYKIAYNTSSKGDPDETIRWILRKLKEYPWEAKLILTLTAFSLNYGECWHLALIYSSNQLAKSISLLKQVAYTYKPAGFPAPPLEAVNDLVLAMMDATRCIFRFHDLGDQIANASDVPQYSHGLKEIIPVTIYWTIRSVLASASQITSLTSLGFNYVISSAEKEELMFLTVKLNSKKEELEKQAELCQPTLEEARMIKRLESIKDLLNAPQVENMIILRALIYYKDDQQPLLYDCKKKKHVVLDVLRKKLVLLLISDVDIPQEDIESVKEIYGKARERKTQVERDFETVWIPIAEQGSEQDIEEKFKLKREAMQWYTVHSPSLIAKEVIKLAKEEWNFENQPIIVVIDPQGQVASPNAFPMIRIWKNLAYPFTSASEEALWKDKIFDLDLLLADIFPEFQNLIEKGNDCICLYGGEDMGWVKMFTARTPSVAEAVNLPLRMVYVGKSKSSFQVKTNIDTIQKEKLSYVMDEKQQRRFWTRITNMLHSRMLLGKTIYEDPVIQEINSLLNSDTSEGGWAAFFTWDRHGESVLMTIAEGKVILNSLIHFTEWQHNMSRREDFIPALEQHLKHHNAYNDGLKHIKSYEEFQQKFKMLHRNDPTRIVKALMSATDYSEPLLFDGVAKKRVKFDFLRPKQLLLLVSDFDILQEEIAMVEAITKEISTIPTARQATKRPERPFEIVWVPIVNTDILHNESQQKRFEMLQDSMPWYSVLNPSVMNETAIKFIKKVFGFDKKTILVVVDEQGWVTCPNALHMMWIWSIDAFPFTTCREGLLWEKESWGLDFLLEGIDQSNWRQEGKHICLYGGDDIKWIRKFTTAAREVAEAEKINLDTVYVGRGNPGDRVREVIEKIEEENLSLYCLDLTSIWYFWKRIESMWRSKVELGRSVKNDPLMKEIMTMLNFDSSEGGWATLFATGTVNHESIKARGNIFLSCLTDYKLWKYDIRHKGFMTALKDYLQTLESKHHCNHLSFPVNAGIVPQLIVCSDCGRRMETYITYKCCNN